jgi:hypothetical protein
MPYRQIPGLSWPLVACLVILGANSLSPRAGAADVTEAAWPYRRLCRPAVPQVRGQDWLKNPVDAYVLARLEKVGLRLAPCADRRTLLRRVTYDLTGLAPTSAECAAFEHDAMPDAYGKVVERLLASPHFGERWAQHWLDVVRYSETEGFKIDRFRPSAFRYRDYVIRAFNSDLPYDRFIRQQLAGDELEPDNPDAQIATGFLRLHPEESNGSNYRQIRQEILDDVTEVVGTTFLGLTIGCARCHDHKFDPIPQEDYFRLQAFFAPMLQRDDVSLLPSAEYQPREQKMHIWLEKTAELRREMDGMLKPIGAAIFKEIAETLDTETQESLRLTAAQRTPLQRQLALLGGKQIDNRFLRMYRRLSPERRAHFEELKKKLAEFDAVKPAELPVAMAVCDVGPEAPPTYRLGGGDYHRKKEQVQPGFPECLDDREPEIHAPAGSTGRRAALAQWLSQPDHPLTGRVMVNRIWAHYFGKGIVGTPNDFGKMGQAPTHPELLDYLASELVRNGWSLKAIHRLIVMSATYRQASAPAHPQALDPENKFLGHVRVRRRDAESVRDVALQISGEINPRMFGESALPELPKQLADDRYAWDPDSRVADRNRRSVYVFHRRNLALPILHVFDAPDRNGTCPARPVTITTPQALLMLNGDFTLNQARHVAGRLLTQARDSHDLVRLAYRTILSRAPTDEEISHAALFLEQQSRRIGAAPPATLPEPMPPGASPAAAAALVDFCHALINCAEFLYVE